MSLGSLKMPGCVYTGAGALDQIPVILQENQVKKIALFADKGVSDAGLLAVPISNIEKSGVPYTLLNDLPPEPTYVQAQKLVDQCKEIHADFIVAVGGGSVLDTAKLASVLMTDAYDVKALLDNPKLAEKFCKTLMIPTTSGTGSEATPNAIVAVPEKELKVGIVNERMIADYVILDAAMVKSMPRGIAAATGIDALAHAVECYTSNKANSFSDLFALEALKRILSSIEKACDDREALAEKESMQIASFYAGVAITSSGTTAVHALSYPLGGKYHIAHGVSNAILLAPVMRFNEPACRQRLAQAYDYCFGADPQLDTAAKSAAMIGRIEEIVRHLDIPADLKQFGVTMDDLEPLVEAGMGVTRLLNNNMRPVTAQDARDIYRQVL
ncbi:iron-containing alcohol dehydrogenase [Breznakiella homolactica]|uniref:Iron-containing alcohol dehydrogenase n=1 Tax=Breznakiella homolactica TaxID=2798577 RepID=A0A7T7XLP4_9SPIR|nr:iron-containing alcohol dehydrogenase [Breznakiella homolactica]QQO08671.1 iron-containing alcohol dehydrogenase [Breznakiella homolactica]